MLRFPSWFPGGGTCCHSNRENVDEAFHNKINVLAWPIPTLSQNVFLTVTKSASQSKKWPKEEKGEKKGIENCSVMNGLEQESSARLCTLCFMYEHDVDSVVLFSCFYFYWLDQRQISCPGWILKFFYFILSPSSPPASWHGPCQLMITWICRMKFSCCSSRSVIMQRDNMKLQSSLGKSHDKRVHFCHSCISATVVFTMHQINKCHLKTLQRDSIHCYIIIIQSNPIK